MPNSRDTGSGNGGGPLAVRDEDRGARLARVQEAIRQGVYAVRGADIAKKILTAHQR